VPVIILTGLGVEDVDHAAMEAGALDYLSKQELTASHLERSIRYSLQQAQTLQALRRAQRELECQVEARTAQVRLQAKALEAAANGIIITAPDGTIQWVNPATAAMTSYSHSPTAEATMPWASSLRPRTEHRERCSATRPTPTPRRLPWLI
jgi:PAS domain-containing protein